MTSPTGPCLVLKPLCNPFFKSHAAPLFDCNTDQHTKTCFSFGLQSLKAIPTCLPDMDLDPTFFCWAVRNGKKENPLATSVFVCVLLPIKLFQSPFRSSNGSTNMQETQSATYAPQMDQVQESMLIKNHWIHGKLGEL